MCLTCWDADKREEKIRMYGPEACLGEDMLTMSISAMQSELTEEWLETNKTNFRIIKEAITDLKADQLSWSVVNPQSQEMSTLNVQFI
jgi:hypothetical protein